MKLAAVTIAIVALLALAWFRIAGDGDLPLPTLTDGSLAPSIVLISLDTTRADHLGIYGYERDTSPGLDALARDGLVFDNAITVSENTLISHASLFTGLFPRAHATTYKNGGTALHADCDTLAEDLSTAGYATAGFTAHGGWLTPKFAMDQGFATFDHGYRPASVVIGGASRWLDSQNARRPVFLFVHLFDAHSDWDARPYDAEPSYLGKYTSSYHGPLRWPDERWPAASEFLAAVSNREIELDASDLQYLIDQYDEGIAGLDARVSAFVRTVRSDRPDAWIIITADHGEEFLEHGFMLHSTQYDEVVRIPLLMIPPTREAARVSAPRRIDGQVRLVDLRPTLRSLAGLGPARRVQGVDLLPWLMGEADENPAGAAPIYYKALRADGYKLIRSDDGPRLYDLSVPGEQTDIAGRPEMAARIAAMRAELARRKAVDQELRESIQRGAGESVELTDEERDRLRSLGYLE